MTTQLAMFLANLFSRICSARAQFVIVVANQHASYLFSTCTIRAVLVLRSAHQLNSGQSKNVWSCSTGEHELDVCAGTVLVVFFPYWQTSDRNVFSKRPKSNFFPTGYPDFAAAVRDKNVP